MRAKIFSNRKKKKYSFDEPRSGGFDSDTAYCTYNIGDMD